MNRPAIDDLLGSLLSTWYETVAEWAPPGQLSSVTCTACPTAALACAMDVSRWPHDLMHQLAGSLEGAIDTIAEALDIGVDGVRAFVIAEVHSWAVEIDDVLEQCVTPRLDEWVASHPIILTPPLRG